MSRGTSPALQGFVDQVFAECLARDIRDVGDISTEVRRQLASEASGELGMAWPTDHELQIIMSRNARGKGEWEYFPAYTKPPRYVSVARVRQLVALVNQGRATDAETEELARQRDDLVRGIRHWRAKHAAAVKRERQLAALVEDIDVPELEGVA